MDALARIDHIAEIRSKIRELVSLEQQAEAVGNWLAATRFQQQIRELDDQVAVTFG